MIRDATLDGSYLGVQFLPSREKTLFKNSIDFTTTRITFCIIERNLFSIQRSIDMVLENILFFLLLAIILPFRSGLSQENTSLVYSFFRLYYWAQVLKAVVNPTLTQ